jgi:hypothetical protein
MNRLVPSTTIKSPDLTNGLGHGPEARQDFQQLTTGSPGRWSTPAATGATRGQSERIPFGDIDDCTYETDETDETKEPEESEEAGGTKETKGPEGSDEIKGPEETNDTEQIGRATETSQSASRQRIDKLNPDLFKRIDGAICDHRVLSYGDFDRPLFMLSNKVRSLEEELNLHFPVATAAEIVRRWKASNQDQLETDYDYLTDFLCKLDLVRFPRGRVLANALERAKNITPPKQTELLSYEVQLLAKLCCILQQDAGTKPFFLDGRSAAKELGKPHRTVASWLHALCRVGVIVLVSKGRCGTASRYRCIAEQETRRGRQPL